MTALIPLHSAAQLLGLSDDKLRELCKQERIKCCRPGGKEQGRIMFRSEWLDEWVERNTREPRESVREDGRDVHVYRWV